VVLPGLLPLGCGRFQFRRRGAQVQGTAPSPSCTDNAARVVAKGVGLRLSPSANPARIAGAVRRLLEERAFGQRARRLAAILREDAAAHRVVAEPEHVGLEGLRQTA
jgi:hypothetical protein